MAIPEMNKQGWLPVGVYDCTLAEIKKRFGTFKVSDWRVKLFEKLEVFIKEARDTGFVSALIINGSFVSNKPVPGDIDLIVVLVKEHDLTGELIPRDYDVVSKKRARPRFGFDILTSEEDSVEFANHLEFFTRIRGTEDRKGVLRVVI